MEIIRKRERHVDVSYELCFYWSDNPHGWYGFDCDEDGNVDVDALPEAARENYEKCVAGELNVDAPRVERCENAYWTPAVGRCDCGNEIQLTSNTNSCHFCGREYNFYGQQLAPRRYWGEETGEHPADVARWMR